MAGKQSGDGVINRATPGRPPRWYAYYYLTDRDGKRKLKWEPLPGITTKTAAKERRAEILGKARRGRHVPRTARTVGDWLTEWLEGIQVGQKTRVGYEDLLRSYVLPELGDIRLSDIDPARVKAFYNRLRGRERKDGRGKLSPTTVTRVHEVLTKALGDAVRDRELARDANPMVDVQRPRTATPEIVVIDTEQTKALLRAAEGTDLWIPVVLGVACGLRRGEIMGLLWRDIQTDAPEPYLQVNRAKQQARQEVYTKEPKTAAGRRQVPLPAFVVDALRQHRAEQVERGCPIGPENEVYTGPNGQITPNALTGKFRDWIVTVDGVTKIRFHDLRHTFASQAIRRGASPRVLQEIMGHASVAITLGIYGHLFPGDKQKVMVGANSELGGYAATAG